MKYDNYFFVVDVETGGLPSKLKKAAVSEVALTELAFVVIDNASLKIIDKKSWLFKPYKEDLIYDPQAAKVSGIDKKFCEKNGLDMKEAFSEMIDFINSYKRKNRKHYLVGQNINNFDLEFIINLFALNKFDISKYFASDVFDTMIWSRLKFVEAPSFSLSSNCQMANITLVDAHRAMNDTIATAELWIYFLKNLRGLEKDKGNQQPNSFRFRDTKFQI